MQTVQAPAMNRVSLTGNALKIIAAITMTIDHIGLIFFPTVIVFRLIGRIAMPIFSYMIAEGCHYTRNKLRYFLGVFLLGVICSAVYMIVGGEWYLCMPVSFSISILLIFALQKAASGRVLWMAVFAAGIALVYLLTQFVHLDYGFWGCMLAVFASIPAQIKRPSRKWCVLSMALPMIPLSLSLGAWQWWSFLALPLLLLYNGRRGKARMKYFFYIFYPGHLAALQGLSWLLAAL